MLDSDHQGLPISTIFVWLLYNESKYTLTVLASSGWEKKERKKSKEFFSDWCPDRGELILPELHCVLSAGRRHVFVHFFDEIRLRRWTFLKINRGSSSGKEGSLLITSGKRLLELPDRDPHQVHHGFDKAPEAISEATAVTTGLH